MGPIRRIGHAIGETPYVERSIACYTDATDGCRLKTAFGSRRDRPK